MHPLRRSGLLTSPLWALVGSGIGLAACQYYNMEAVDPQTVIAVETSGTFERTLPPSLLIVQDRSGSMEICFDQDVFAGVSRGCLADAMGDTRDPDRRSRMEISQQVMKDVVAASKDEVEFGLLLYGVDPDQPNISCAPPHVIAEPAADSHEAVSEAYRSSPFIVNPAGGTPTTLALRRSYELLVDEEGHPRRSDRRTYVVLVTDGLMNCNSAHAMPCTCASETGCFGPGGAVAYGEDGTMEARQCLDDAASLSEIEDLRKAGISTFVIGLGESFSGEEVIATRVLDALAVAGGVPQEGAPQKFYSAGNAEQLQSSLEKIIAQISAPCEYELDGPVCDGRLIKINLNIDDEVVETSCSQTPEETTWFFAEQGGVRDPQRIVFSPPLCTRLSEANAVSISIKGVENACTSVDGGATPQPACSQELVP